MTFTEYKSYFMWILSYYSVSFKWEPIRGRSNVFGCLTLIVFPWVHEYLWCWFLKQRESKFLALPQSPWVFWKQRELNFFYDSCFTEQVSFRFKIWLGCIPIKRWNLSVLCKTFIKKLYCGKKTLAMLFFVSILR